MRKLCTVRIISKLEPIKNADRIELALIDGWECVVKKGEFSEGDTCLYFEIDSLLPETEPFEFMRPRKFRVRTIKLKKQISQGLALPLSVLSYFLISPNSVKVGDDLTSKLGIKKYDPEATKKLKRVSPKKKIKQTKLNNFLLRLSNFIKGYGWVIDIYKYPSFIKKTDEERIQNVPQVLIHRQGKVHHITEKLDGCSASYAYYKGKFYVCSRNRNLVKDNNSQWWKIANKYDLKNKLKNQDVPLIIQGEIIGPDVPSNKYKLKDLDFYVFTITIISNGIPVGLEERLNITESLGLKHVPVLNKYFVFEENLTVQKMVTLASGKSKITPDMEREGIVVRWNIDDRHSFKVVNPEFLLKYKE